MPRGIAAARTRWGPQLRALSKSVPGSAARTTYSGKRYSPTALASVPGASGPPKYGRERHHSLGDDRRALAGSGTGGSATFRHPSYVSLERPPSIEFLAAGVGVRNARVSIMRKLALLLAASLLVAAPLSAATPTLIYAAGKAKKAAKRALPAKRVVTKETAKEVGPMEANTRFARALDDLFRSLATYRYVYDPATGGEAGKGGKKAAKKAR